VSGASCIQTPLDLVVGLNGVTLQRASVRVTRDGVTSALQVIFHFEPRSDLLDHFATVGVVD
jgi:hypothetical protein